MIKKYVDYLKDNPQGYWFKRKLYGWGWTPATWQGWLTTLIFIVLVVWNAVRLDSVSHSASDTLTGVVPQTIGLVVLFLIITYVKGEKPKWQWGIPKKEDRE